MTTKKNKKTTAKKKKTPENRVLLTFTLEDLRTAADQSKGLPTYECVADILKKYDVENDILVAATEVVEEILYDYDSKYGIKYE